jgi:hypothetical protein
MHKTRQCHTEICRGPKRHGDELWKDLRLRRCITEFVRANGNFGCRGLDAASAGHTRRGMLGSSAHGAMVSAFVHGTMATRAAALAGATVRRGPQCQTPPKRWRCAHAERQEKNRNFSH